MQSDNERILYSMLDLDYPTFKITHCQYQRMLSRHFM